MDEILYDDMHTLYLGGVCMYKGIPVKVMNITRKEGKPMFELLYLELQKKGTVVFKMDDFGPPIGRIGFVNHGNAAFYVTRRPSRQWAIGLKSSNVRVKCTQSIFLKGVDQFNREVSKMELKTLAHSMLGKYPKFEEALAQAIETKGVYAFDRQFAIDHEKTIFYKTNPVGKLKRGKKLQYVEFNPGFEYLELPLMQHYEKTFRTFEA